MVRGSRGFSLLEVLVSLAITMVIGAAIFQLFQQNERVFHDQNLISEMQQAARLAISRSADEIRMAGQGSPVYAASYDANPNEDVVAILSGSTSTRINFRASLAPAESIVIAPMPASFIVGTPITLTMDDTAKLYDAVGGSPTGRFVYLGGDVGNARWGWLRASINSVAPLTKSVQVTPSQAGPDGQLIFAASPKLSLEEAIAIYLDTTAGVVKRTTATNLSNPTNPSWAPANELVTDVVLLQFDYMDRNGVAIIPDTLINRARVASVDIRLVAQTTEALSNHARATFALRVRTIIRNSTIR